MRLQRARECSEAANNQGAQRGCGEQRGKFLSLRVRAPLTAACWWLRAPAAPLRADGQSLWCPNRGADTVACFAVDPATGALALVGSSPCGHIPQVKSVFPAPPILPHLKRGLAAGNFWRLGGDNNRGGLRRRSSSPRPATCSTPRALRAPAPRTRCRRRRSPPPPPPAQHARARRDTPDPHPRRLYYDEEALTKQRAR